MRTLLLATFVATVLPTVSNGQSRLIGEQFERYYNWFHERSQVLNQFTDGATLVVFSQNTKVHAAPSRRAAVVGHFDIGQEVRNHLLDPQLLQQDDINGYGDLWFEVSACDGTGKLTHGFVWGADLARAWREVRFPGSDQTYTVMLGISSDRRTEIANIGAELRTLRGQQLVHRQQVPGLCVFEDCGSSTLLRVIDNCPHPGAFVLEASTLTAGCFAGVEKAFFYWTGEEWQRFYYAEYTTAHEFANTPFRYQTNAQVEMCRYSHEDSNYNPVVICKTVALPTTKPKAKA